MIENIEESKFVELRKEFYKETRTFAMTNKKGYTKWLEAKLVKKLTIPNVSQQREPLNGIRQWLIDEKKNINIYQHLIDEYLKTL